jgi:GTP-binding protein
MEHVLLPSCAQQRGVQAGTTVELEDTLQPLFEAIMREVPPPSVYPDAPLQLLVTNIDYDEHKGRICIARINAGTLTAPMPVAVCRSDTDVCRSAKVAEIFTYADFTRVKVDSASAGDIVAIAGALPSRWPHISITLRSHCNCTRRSRAASWR